MTRDDLPSDTGVLAALLAALLAAERARHAAEIAKVIGERDELRDETERLRAMMHALQRHRFGARSEQLDPAQLALGLEDIEQSLAAAEAAAEHQAAPRTSQQPRKPRKSNRGALPRHLPRIEQVIDIGPHTCPCCASTLHRIGEEVQRSRYMTLETIAPLSDDPIVSLPAVVA